MEKATIIGIDLAKRVFQLHGAGSDGFGGLSQEDFQGEASFISCITTEVRGGHGGLRRRTCLGARHSSVGPRSTPDRAVYVKPFVKRQKNDMADAEAISEAAARPTMRFVTVKGADKQASAMVFKTRDLLVRQRIQSINALRGHLTEHGIIAPQGYFTSVGSPPSSRM